MNGKRASLVIYDEIAPDPWEPKEDRQVGHGPFIGINAAAKMSGADFKVHRLSLGLSLSDYSQFVSVLRLAMAENKPNPMEWLGLTQSEWHLIVTHPRKIFTHTFMGVDLAAPLSSYSAATQWMADDVEELRANARRLCGQVYNSVARELLSKLVSEPGEDALQLGGECHQVPRFARTGALRSRESRVFLRPREGGNRARGP